MKRGIGFLLIGIFALLLLVIATRRAQPNDSDLRDLLLPGGCALPCWQGIQSGVTTADEALAIFRAHPWVKPESVRGFQTGLTSPTNFQANMRIIWQWDRQQPAVAQYVSQEFAGSYIQVRRGIVQYIRIATRVPYGDVQTLMGMPDIGTLRLDNPGAPNPRYAHTAGYFGGQVVFDSDVSCPITAAAFWNAPVVITYSDGSYVSLQSMPDYDLAQQLFIDSC